MSLYLNSSQGTNVNIECKKLDYTLHQHKSDPSYNTSVRTYTQKFNTSLQLKYKYHKNCMLFMLLFSMLIFDFMSFYRSAFKCIL